jgi:hypothetical protein
MSDNSQLQQIRIYRTNKENKGFATAWQLSFKKDAEYDPYLFFLVMAKQDGLNENGNAKYDWKGAINVKLGVFELGEIIAVLDGRKTSVGYNGSLYHQTDQGNKIIKLNATDKGYSLTVSSQDTNKNNLGPFYQTLSDGEAVVLSTMLKKAIERIFGW